MNLSKKKIIHGRKKKSDYSFEFCTTKYYLGEKMLLIKNFEKKVFINFHYDLSVMIFK